MEEEMARLQKEKDELAAVQRTDTAGASKDIAERRRKKIQELEEKISDLKKKQVEQQRMANMAKQNEEKAKRYQQEIVQIKAAKVKLVKQMKEESDRVRIWKQGKEKEVVQLKQADRKKQVEMSKMSLQHERKQNVLKRRMEEVMAINKRLKDAQAKKTSAQSMRAATTSTGLTGAGERIRGWVKTEIDVVVSAKEAELARTQLIKERKALNEEMNKIKADSRRTMTSDEMDQVSAKQSELMEQLEMRNVQISELQKEIMLADQDKEKNGDRWQKMTSMTEAKLAIAYLFNNATEAMANFANKNHEVRELKGQIEDLLANSASLKEKLTDQKMSYETEVSRIQRENEQNVLVLLTQMYSETNHKSQDISGTKEVIEKMIGDEKALESALEKNEKMTFLEAEVARLQAELVQLKSGGNGAVFQLPDGANIQEVKKIRRTTIVKSKEETRYTAEEYFKENYSDSSEDAEDSDTDSSTDQEWRKTPMGKRIKTARKSLLPAETKRKRAGAGAGALGGITEEDTEDDCADGKQRKKRSTTAGCGCKTGCKTKACSCRKNGPFCSSSCKCLPNKCSYREEPGSDVSVDSNVDTDKENEVNGAEDGADTTDHLLNGSFELSGKLNFENLISKPSTPDKRTPLGPSIFKTPNNGADMFAEESDIEATPIVKEKFVDSSPNVDDQPMFPAPKMDIE